MIGLQRRRTKENIVAVVLLVIFAGVIWLCQDFGPRARMIPLPLAILGIALTLLQLVWQNVRSTEELKMDLIAVSDQPPTASEEVEKEEAAAATRAPSFSREWIAYTIVALLIGLVLVVGLVPAVLVFTAGYVIATHQYSWVRGLVYTTAFTAALYLLFFAALQIEPYHGLLTPLAEFFK